MGKLTDKLKHYGKIAALTTIGLFLPPANNSQPQSDNNTNPTETAVTPPQEADFNDVIEFEASPAQTFQVDTISDPKIIQQVNEGTYEGSFGYYNDVANTITLKYFKGADYQPAEKEIIKVHEGAHFEQANTYGMPIGITTPNQNYVIEIANEFNSYFKQTSYELNRSVEENRVIGMNDDVNRRFGDMLEDGLLQYYTSGDEQDLQEFLSVMTNTIFEDTRNMMVNSELYTDQMLYAATHNSDICGYPEDIKRANFEQAIKDAFTVEMTDANGNLHNLNLYDYLTDENKALLETIAPQHQEEMAKINADIAQQIEENTAQRLADWDKEAEIIAAEEGIAKQEVLQEFQAEFEAKAHEFTFPGESQYRTHDAENHVSEVMQMPQYDAAIHTAEDLSNNDPVNYEYTDNSAALNNVRNKLQDLHQRKNPSLSLLADESALKTFETRTIKQTTPQFVQTDSRNI